MDFRNFFALTANEANKLIGGFSSVFADQIPANDTTHTNKANGYGANCTVGCGKENHSHKHKNRNIPNINCGAGKSCAKH